MEKAKRIIEKLKAGKTISQIAREERINRHSVSLVKQTMEIVLKETYLEFLREELSKYGFLLENGELKVVEDIRTIQGKLAEETNGKYRKLKSLVGKYFANSLSEINPLIIKPRLQLINTYRNDKETRLLKAIFNYAKSFWSVPVSAGFGRRMNYILWDDNVGKVIGIFGLCDPVIGLEVRDNFIGWDRKTKEKRLYNIMTAYILGAVPPYNQLLGGKLVALSVLTKEVLEDFRTRYGKNGEKLPYLVAVDTMGAFGKSAIYNRLKGWKFVGYTKGQSHLHLTLNGAYRILVKAIKEFGNPEILKSYTFKHSPNYKLRVVSEGLRVLGLNKEKLTSHSIRRGYYFAPLTENWRDFLLGRTDEVSFKVGSLEENFNYWKERWLVKRLKKFTG